VCETDLNKYKHVRPDTRLEYMIKTRQIVSNFLL